MRKLVKIIKTGLAALLLNACANGSPKWPEPPIAQRNPTPAEAPKPKEEAILIEIPLTYKFDKPSTRSAFEGLVRETAPGASPEAMLAAAINIGGEDGMTEQELLEFCKKGSFQPPYIKTEGDIRAVVPIDITNVDLKTLKEIIEALKAKGRSTPTEPEKPKPETGPVERTYTASVTFESDLIKAYANGFVSEYMALREVAPESPINAELRMREYRIMAGEDGKVAVDDLEKTLNGFEAHTQKSVKPKYEGLDPEKVEVKVTMPAEQANRLDALIKKYKPDDSDVVLAVKQHSAEVEKDGKKTRVMTDKDVDAIAADWQKVYE